MCDIMVKNIKCSFILNKTPETITAITKLRHKKGLVTKKENSFFVIRNEFVYTIFLNGHINCTKISSVHDIEKAVHPVFTGCNT